jgi:vancomycin aglycone glucosyltransferase
MRVLLSAYGPRGGVELVVGLALWLLALGTQMRVCAPPDCAAAEGRDALVATGVMPTGVWR